MVICMKTTIDLSDPLFSKIKKHSQEKGTTMKTIIESALRLFFDQRQSGKKVFHLKKTSFCGDGLVDGLQEGDWEEIRGRIYEGRGG